MVTMPNKVVLVLLSVAPEGKSRDAGNQSVLKRSRECSPQCDWSKECSPVGA